MKKIIILSLLVIATIVNAQNTLNDYNRAIIPAKFSFQKSDDQYRINSTIKTFLKQKGFEVYLSNEAIPEGFMDYNCNKIFVNVVEESNMFKTTLEVEFKDCKGAVLFKTAKGISNDKEYAKAYNTCLVTALKSFSLANYKYSGKTYDDEEVEEKLKATDKVDVSTANIKTEKSEINIKVFNAVTKEELILFKTSKPDVFLCTKNGVSGVVLSKGGVWYFESIAEEKVVAEKLSIKF